VRSKTLARLSHRQLLKMGRGLCVRDLMIRPGFRLSTFFLQYRSRASTPNFSASGPDIVVGLLTVPVVLENKEIGDAFVPDVATIPLRCGGMGTGRVRSPPSLSDCDS